MVKNINKLENRKMKLSTNDKVFLYDVLEFLKSELSLIDDFNKVKEFIVYGSYASGEETEDSDLDIAVVLDNGVAEEFKEKIHDELAEIVVKCQFDFCPLFVHFIIYEEDSWMFNHYVKRKDYYKLL